MRVAVGIAILSVIIPVRAHAACLLDSMNGTWDFYTLESSSGAPQSEWERCDVRIYTQFSSPPVKLAASCQNQANVPSAFTGTLTVNGNCIITGSLDHTIRGASQPTVTLTRSTGSLDHNSFMGVGQDAAGKLYWFWGLRRGV